MRRSTPSARIWASAADAWPPPLKLFQMYCPGRSVTTCLTIAPRAKNGISPPRSKCASSNVSCALVALTSKRSPSPRIALLLNAKPAVSIHRMWPSGDNRDHCVADSRIASVLPTKLSSTPTMRAWNAADPGRSRIASASSARQCSSSSQSESTKNIVSPDVARTPWFRAADTPCGNCRQQRTPISLNTWSTCTGGDRELPSSTTVTSYDGGSHCRRILSNNSATWSQRSRTGMTMLRLALLIRCTKQSPIVSILSRVAPIPRPVYSPLPFRIILAPLSRIRISSVKIANAPFA